MLGGSGAHGVVTEIADVVVVIPEPDGLDKNAEVQACTVIAAALEHEPAGTTVT
jgi:hypothetical protein